MRVAKITIYNINLNWKQLYNESEILIIQILVDISIVQIIFQKMITDQFSGQIPDLARSWTNSGQIPNVRNDHVLEHFPDNKQCPEFVYYYSEHFLDIFWTFCFYRVDNSKASLYSMLWYLFEFTILTRPFLCQVLNCPNHK